MSTVITQRELRNDNADIMRRLDEGESFIVTSNGRPVGELNPLHRPPVRVLHCGSRNVRLRASYRCKEIPQRHRLSN